MKNIKYLPDGMTVQRYHPLATHLQLATSSLTKAGREHKSNSHHTPSFLPS